MPAIDLGQTTSSDDHTHGLSMIRALLSTKITLPPVQQGHISRGRLSADPGRQANLRLILISAPAGFGKSICLLEWCHALRQDGTKIVWYALDAQDNDPARFASHLAGAFARAVEEDADGFAEPATAGNLDSVMAVLVNTLAQTPDRFVFAFDDYHLIAAPEIHAALGLMLEHLPANAQIALATRADPPLQLSRLRARGQVLEVRAADLRFTAPEIEQFFAQAVGLRLSRDHLDQLDQLSEGWAAALRLITLSLGGAGQAVDSHGVGEPLVNDRSVERILSRFSPAKQHIFDYLADEVFEQQPEETRQYLLDTCVLDHLTPELCGVITGNCGAPLLLERLVRGRLFVIPLAESEPIFRYHHLFADFLRQRLRQADLPRWRERQRQAAEWYEQHADWTQAVHHALNGEEYAYAAWLIEARAWEALTSRGEIMTVLAWLPRFPQDELKEHPRLCLYFSRAMYLTGDLQQSLALVTIATQAIKGLDPSAAETVELRTIAYSYQATLAAYRGQIADGLALAEQALADRETLNRLGQTRLVNTIGYLYYASGKIAESRRFYQEAYALAQEIGHAFLMIDAQHFLAELDIAAGELGAAEARCAEMLTQYPRDLAPIGDLVLSLANVHYERNDLTRAEALLREAIQLSRSGGLRYTQWVACVALARVLAVEERFDEAQAMLRQAMAVAAAFNGPTIQSLVEAMGARLALLQGQVEEAADWLGRDAEVEALETLRHFEILTRARVLLALRHPPEALPLLEAFGHSARADGRHGHALEADVLRALALNLSGQLPAALTVLKVALPQAEREGYVRVFLDEGAPMLRLLARAGEAGISPAYVGLLREAENAARRVHPADLLSDRELDVLRLLAQGATNHDIVDALVISLGTVKSHINHIMTKLDARNRTEAVAKARSLGLLDGE
ncbi:MAG: hypothetical protein IPK19_15870 [Chloroflexi bacterium]|nr:hypothetical protein [Chloroflexota bacterium]